MGIQVEIHLLFKSFARIITTKYDFSVIYDENMQQVSMVM